MKEYVEIYIKTEKARDWGSTLATKLNTTSIKKL